MQLILRKHCTLVVVTLAAGAAVIAAHAQSASSPKLAEEQYKNIKVLKGVPAEQVIPAMQFITASLGVECEYCHVREGQRLIFDKDDKKPKLAARKMIDMMNAINKDNFEGKREVTCFSCHRGAAHPVGVPIITDEEAKPETASEHKPGEAEPAMPPADPILDKYLAAVGGADAVQKVTSRIEKGTVTAFGGQRVPVDIYSKAPDKRASFMHTQGGDSVTAFDGHGGWLGFPGRPLHVMTAEENDGARMDADLHFPVHLKTLRQHFLAGPGEKIDGRETVQVVGRTEGEAPLRLYFDTQSGLLLRLVRYAETPLGRLPTQIDYGDYRQAGSLKIPFRWSLARPGNRFTIQVDEVHDNVPVDDAKFAAPPPPADGQNPH